MRQIIAFCLLLASHATVFAQENVLSLEEYLAMVKLHHPIVKQANLQVDESEVKLLKARGAMDPKLAANFDSKEFHDISYFKNFSTAFSIPTWYGLSFKGGYENNEGEYLNPQLKTPDKGLLNLGVSVDVARNLLMNERKATLQKAQWYQKEAEAKNILQVNYILYDAMLAYFDWIKAYKQLKLYENFEENALVRLEGVRRSFEEGESPAIDTTEATINWQNRGWQKEKAQLAYRTSTYELSNYLWLNGVPLDLQAQMTPNEETRLGIDQVIPQPEVSLWDNNLELHPKIQSISSQIEQATIEQKMRKNDLLPNVQLQYNLLSRPDEITTSHAFGQYKAGISFGMPLTFRKERAALKQATIQLESLQLLKEQNQWQIQNKWRVVEQELLSYERQMTISQEVIANSEVMLQGEERKFQVGESSLFVVNSRESKLIESKLKWIDLENLYLQKKASRFLVSGWEF